MSTHEYTVSCPTCNGTGMVHERTTFYECSGRCEVCEGKKRISLETLKKLLQEDCDRVFDSLREIQRLNHSYRVIPSIGEAIVYLRDARRKLEQRLRETEQEVQWEERQK